MPCWKKCYLLQCKWDNTYRRTEDKQQGKDDEHEDEGMPKIRRIQEAEGTNEDKHQSSGSTESESRRSTEGDTKRDDLQAKEELDLMQKVSRSEPPQNDARSVAARAARSNHRSILDGGIAPGKRKQRSWRIYRTAGTTIVHRTMVGKASNIS